MLLIILQMIFILFLLAVMGEPWRFLFFNHFKLFSELDFIRICVLDVYIGGFILYGIAILPFQLFSESVIFCVIGIAFFISFILHRKKLINVLALLRKRSSSENSTKRFLNYLVVFVIFITFLLLIFFSSSNLVLGSIHDESIHSLYVQVILENNFIPVTLQPYLPEGIIYPQASHVIFAFASHLTSLEVPKVILYVSNLFKALSVIGAYFLGKQLSSHKAYSLSFSFVIAFMSSWPLFVTWGGNPFLVGFPLFLICLGMFPYLLRLKNSSFAEVIFIGLIFGYLGAIIISYLQTLLFIGFFVLIFYAAQKYGENRKIFLKLVIAFSISLIPLTPFLFRFIAFYNYPGHNIGVPEDFVGWMHQQFFPTQALQWAFENLHPYVLLRIITIFLIISLGVLLWKTKNYKNVKRAIALALALFASTAFLSFISFFLPADFGIVSWGHQGIIMSISIDILLAVLLVKITQLCSDWAKKHMSHVVFSKSFHASTVITISVLSLITAPYLYYRFSADPWTIQGAYNIYGIVTLDDYNLMLWMRENLSTSAVVLVHPFEAGLFIPSISHHKIVFPFSGSRLSRSYQMLVLLMETTTLNLTTYELLQHLDISHVFVGATVVSADNHCKWVPELFLGNPNFKLVKNFGDAYLFEFKEYDPSIVFLDDFEYQSWQQNRWLNNYFGNGLGNVTIMAGLGENESKCLMITAQAVPIVWDWDLKYAYCVSREIFVWNCSEVTLSFYLNTSQGFSGNDTFAVFVSNIYRNQSLIVATTPNGIYKNYAGAILLNQSEGFFEFKGNKSLSALWRKKFNSPLPTRFILEFVNWDLDGIKNVVYLDNIQVTSTIISEPPEEAGYD